MTADSIITNAFSVAQGKAVPPAAGTAKYAQLLQIIDRKQKEWSHEPGVTWSSLYERQTLTAAAGDTFELDDTVDYIVNDTDDPVRVGTQVFRLVRPTQLYRYRESYACAKVGATLVFSHPLDARFATQTITVPTILKVDDIALPTDETQVDDPLWLVYAAAAEFARNDIVKSSQYANLYDIANNLMARMKEANDGSYEEVEREPIMDLMSWD